MKVKIWGARGSIPAPIDPAEIREKIIYALQGAKGVDLDDPLAVRTYVNNMPPLLSGTAGGNTSCIELKTGHDIIIIDAGSGLRSLGHELLKGPCGRGQGVIHLFLSHTHWDHIQGFPFFVPAFIRGNRIKIYSVHDVATTIADQMKTATFPVTLDYMQSTIEFVQLEAGQHIRVGDVHVSNMELPHPGKAYAFRFEQQGSVFVYASDAEYKNLSETHLQPYLQFFAKADMLIFDAQFTLREAFLKEDWGHSSALIGVDMARRAGVKQLVLFHHDPTTNDFDLQLMLEETLAYAAEQAIEQDLQILVGREELEVDLTPTSVCLLSWTAGEETAVLRLMGDLDERVVIELQKKLADITPTADVPLPALIFDMEATTRLSVAGLRVLIDLRQRWGSVPLVLAGPSNHVLRVIKLADYLDFFAVYPTVQQAQSALEAQRNLQLPGQLLRGRYHIESQLGKSDLGFLLKATDLRLNRPVVIKALSISFSQQALERFIDETRRIAQLNAPNIVTVYDCNEENGLVYVVSEYCPGKTLRSLMDSGQALPTLDIALEILQALEYAHSKGVVHGNLKPENVLLTDEIKLTDFGLRWVEQGRRLTETPAIVSSPEYLAPEQILGQIVEPRTDLYAFGVILYEMFTGKRPFTGETTAEILKQHLNETPIPPRQHKPEISRLLEHLILKLLIREPEQRYATATQVRRVLVRLRHTPHSQNSKKLSEANWKPLTLPRHSNLIGRENQLERLRHVWRLAKAGQGQITLITGEAGIGKTRLIEELIPQVGHATALIGRCSELEGRTPYQPFIEAFRAYIARTPLSTFKMELGENAPVLASLLPEIRAIMPHVTAVAPEQAEHERLRLMHAILQFITNATENSPWLLVIDDLHWADHATLQLLHYLARHLGRLPLFILGTYRDVELEQDHVLHELQRDLSRLPVYQNIVLGRLKQNDVQQLIARLLDQTPPDEWVKAIFQRTGGNPFYVEEVVKDLTDEGSIYQQNGSWQFAPLIEVSLPQKIHNIILRRMIRLNPITQDLLRLAAVLGQQFSFHDLVAVSQQSEEQLLESLDELLERDMLQESSGSATLVFNHAEIQEVIYTNLNPLRRRLLHRQIAYGLEAAYQGKLPTAVRQLAHHFSQAGDNEKGFLYSLQAAQQAQELSAYQIALNWYLEAEKMATKAQPSNAELVVLYEGLGNMLRSQTHYEEAKKAFKEMETAAARNGDLETQARAWNRLSDVYDSQGDNRSAFNSAQKAADLAEEAHASGELIAALYSKGWAACRMGNLATATKLGERMLHLANEMGSDARREQALSLNLLGMIYNIAGNFEQADKYQLRALALYRELGNRGRIGVMLNNLGANAEARGDYPNALSYYQEALEIHRAINNRLDEALVLGNLGSIELSLGQYNQAQEHLHQGLAIAGESDWLLARIHHRLADTYLAQDQVAQAFDAIQQSLTLSEATEDQDLIGRSLRTLALILAHPAAESLPHESLPDDGKTAVACFAKSLHILSEIGASAERARTLREWGCYLMTHGDAEQGDKMWQEALAIFEKLNMPTELNRMKARARARVQS